MPCKVIQFSNKNQIELEKLKKYTDKELDILGINDPMLLECFKSRMKELIDSKYLFEPDIKLEIKIPERWSSDQKAELEKYIRKAVTQYELQKSKYTNGLLREIAKLNGKLCKFEVMYEK